MKNKSKLNQVTALMAKGMKANDIMKATGMAKATVYNYMSTVRKKQALPMTAITVDVIKKKMGRPRKITLSQSELAYKLAQGRAPMRMKQVADNVNHPAHYKVGGIETIDFIEAKKLSYNLGNVVKYITRADHKGNRKEDLLKAQWYLARELKNLG